MPPLDGLTADIAVVAALHGDVYAPSSLLALSKAHGVTPADEAALRLGDIKDATEQLLQMGVLTEAKGRERVQVSARHEWPVLRDAAETGRLQKLGAPFLEVNGGRVFYESSDAIASVRLKLLLEHDDGPEQLQLAVRFLSAKQAAQALIGMVGRSPKASYLSALDEKVLEAYLGLLCDEALLWLTPFGHEMLALALQSGATSLRAKAVRVLMLAGETPKADDHNLTRRYRAETLLYGHMLGQRLTEALDEGEPIALQKDGRPRSLSVEARWALNLARMTKSSQSSRLFEALQHQVEIDQTRPTVRETPGHMLVREFCRATQFARPFKLRNVRLGHTPWPWHDVLTLALCLHWSRSKDHEPSLLRLLDEAAERAQRGGFSAAQRLLSEARHALSDGEDAADGLTGAYHIRASWELALDALSDIARADDAPTGRAAMRTTGRVLFRLAALPDHTTTSGHSKAPSGLASLEPCILATARAKTPKPISVDQLLANPPSFMSKDDRAVLDLATTETMYRNPWSDSRVSVRKLDENALPALIGHEGVIDEQDRPVVVSRGEGELLAEEVKGGRTIRLRISPPALVHHDIVLRQTGPGQMLVYERSEDMTRVAALFEDGELQIPKQGGERLGQVLGELGRKIRIGTDERVPVRATTVTAETRPAFLCRWTGETLDVRVRMVPFGPDGPQVIAGRGPSQIVTTRNGQSLRVMRDLEAEEDLKDAILSLLPQYAFEADNLSARGLPEALDFMEALAALDDDSRLVAWPDGRTLPTLHRVGVPHLRVQMGSAKDWLTASLSVETDAQRVVNFETLLSQAADGSRYVALDDGSFLSLTEELRRRMADFIALGLRPPKVANDDEPWQAPKVALPLLMRLTEGAGHRALDEATEAAKSRLESAMDAILRVPKTFEGALRDYQFEGVQWMHRLGQAGLGAILADDMGLGKTVQTLALLCLRASEGPALVVAPTSMIGTWEREAQRFAKGLEVAQLTDAKRRRELIKSARPGQILLTTYGMLATSKNPFADTHFATVVFDEAHALKNLRARRTQVARQIEASFRVALTGTPVENHLGELYSLVDTIVPGLLGDEKRFQGHVMEPIKTGSRAHMVALRRTLAPFLLRRTKAEVLDDLPERTETTLLITPGKDERAFYEALRKRALKALLKGDVSGTTPNRIRVLGEILKLRQAAIAPRLVDQNYGPESAKLDVLVERVVALHSEGHRPLIFTQFLESLGTIERRLGEAGLTVLTLDGSLSAAARSARVDAFQRGDGDAFVMSLHAGGVGVTLTAADYVFHVDPWWNPAVEEQATGRAHRIGQTRPVHVYRLISEGTIEEKMLALHRQKRQLSNDILEDMGGAGALDSETLLSLLR